MSEQCCGKKGIRTLMCVASGDSQHFRKGEESLNDWKLPWEGGCLYGEIRFRVSAPPLLTSTSLQRLPEAQRERIFPNDRRAQCWLRFHERRTRDWWNAWPHRRLYCPHCKNRMFTQPQGMDCFVNVRATMLDKHLLDVFSRYYGRTALGVFISHSVAG
jgi:hypothetical protein